MFNNLNSHSSGHPEGFSAEETEMIAILRDMFADTRLKPAELIRQAQSLIQSNSARKAPLPQRKENQMNRSNPENLMAELQKPFPAREIEWRVHKAGLTGKRPWVMVLPYLNNRAIMNRLDQVLGLGNWSNEFRNWHANATLCGISCRINGEWITKWDGAADSGIEPVKGGLSDAMKRAAVQWGMGRYLYQLPPKFISCSLEKPAGNTWRKYHHRPDDTVFYWQPPSLPAWALPEEPESASAIMTTAARPADQAARFLKTFQISQSELKQITGIQPDSPDEADILLLRQVARVMRRYGCNLQTAMEKIA